MASDLAESKPASSAEVEAARNRPTRRLRRWKRAAGLKAVRLFGAPFLHWLSRSWDLRVLREEHLVSTMDANAGHFMALWHGRMILGLPHHASHQWWVLVSPSRDGDISESLLKQFQYKVIRGSSSRTGFRSLREMLRVLKDGGAIVLTPDGPRGPRHAVNAGIAWLASTTGYPIVPVGFAVDRAWRMKSWDAFTIPKRKARVAMVYGTPVHVPRKADEAELERARTRVHDALVEAEEYGFRQLGLEPDW